MISEAPLALIGHGPELARALRGLGLVALSVPTHDLARVLGAAQTLRFAGALIAPECEEAVYPHVKPDGAAHKLNRADALSLAGNLNATHTLEDALRRLVEESGYAVRGARLLVVGEGPALIAALGLVRLGALSVLIAAPSRPEAGAALPGLPAGVTGHAVAATDLALPALAERADLVVLASGTLPPGVLHPVHTLLDLTGSVQRAAVPALGAADLPALRLGLQLEHATGQRFTPEALRAVAG